jgi:hypothetical protein
MSRLDDEARDILIRWRIQERPQLYADLMKQRAEADSYVDKCGISAVICQEFYDVETTRKGTLVTLTRREDEMRSSLIDIAAQKRGETEKAFRLYDGKRTEWVPKSQVEDNGDGTFTMPEWLAEDKGFI